MDQPVKDQAAGAVRLAPAASLAGSAAGRAQVRACLTQRQLEVLEWAGEGKSNWEIGRILALSEETVKKHLQEVYRKLAVPNRLAAANCLRG